MPGLFDWILLGTFAGFCTLSFVYEAKDYPEVRGWRAMGIVSMITYYFLAGYSPLLWDEYLGEYTLFDASSLPLWVAIPVGFIVLQLGIYVWHRTMHNTDPLWRWFHQMHHSAERLDIFGAFYFHPLDMLGFTFVGSLMLVGLFGLSGEAAAVVNLMAAFCSMFQHLNVNTPRWLGYLVTRPESHSIHHKKDHHANNYGDIPLFDMIFGTFHNPVTFADEVGFGAGESHKVVPMLAGRAIA